MKAHICINESACHRGYFVGLLFREISLKSEEQNNRTDKAFVNVCVDSWRAKGRIRDRRFLKVSRILIS